MGGLGSDTHIPVGSQVSPAAAMNASEAGKGGGGGGEVAAESLVHHPKLVKGLDFIFRIMALSLCLTILVLLKENVQTTVIPPGFKLQAKYDNTKAPKALLVVSSVCLAYSAFQAALSLFTFCKRRLRALDTASVSWFIFLCDQVLTYLLLGASAATAEAAYIAKHGEDKVQWKPVCAPFKRFCNHFAAAVFISFLAVINLAFSSIISAYYLFRRYQHPSSSPAAAFRP